jgi:AbrB family looped-hinge helix DNA binding protein
MKTYAKLSEKGQVVLPKEVRRVLGVRGGDRVYFLVEDDKVEVRPYTKSLTELMKGIGKKYWESIDAKAYLAKERKTWKK